MVTKQKRKLTVRQKIEQFLSESTDVAFIRKEFEPFGGYRQVSRVLKQLIDEGRLMRAGYGIFVKSYKAPSRAKSSYGEIRTYPKMDVVGVAFEVLPKLGYEVDINSFEEKNLKGLCTQIAYAPMVRVKGRIRREIKVRGTALIYETS